MVENRPESHVSPGITKHVTVYNSLLRGFACIIIVEFPRKFQIRRKLDIRRREVEVNLQLPEFRRNF